MESNNECDDTSAATSDKKHSENDAEQINCENIPSKPTMISSNINKDQANKYTDTVHERDSEGIENVEVKNINENKTKNPFQFQDIINVKEKRNNPRIHTKYDKHRQLNINVNRKVKTSQIITKHKPENNQMKSRDIESVKDVSKNVEQTNSGLGGDVNENFGNKKIEKPNVGDKLDSPREVNNSDLTLLKTENLSLQSTILKSDRETIQDIASDVHSLTRTLSPNKENLLSGSELRENDAVSYAKQELKMSDLTTPATGTYRVEQEMELLRNKVRQLKGKLRNLIVLRTNACKNDC